VVDAGFDVQSDTFNGSALTLGAIFFLIVTIPLARLVDRLIVRQHRKTERGGAQPPQPGIAGAGVHGAG